MPDSLPPDSGPMANGQCPAIRPVGEIASLTGVRGVATWVWDVQANTVVYSREWKEILLRPDDDAARTMLSHWWPDVHEDDVQPFLEAARDIVEGVTEDYQTMFRVRRADGEWAWLLSRGRVTAKTGGRPARVCGVLMDITFLRSDIKFIHGSAGMSAPQYYTLPEDAAEALAAEDSGALPRRSNCTSNRYLSSGSQVFSEKADSFSGMSADQRSHVLDCVRQVFTSGLAMRKVVTFATDYGHDVTGEYIFWPECDENGKVVAVMTQFWDLTDTILANRRAKLNEMRLEALYRLTQMSTAPEDELVHFVLESLVRLTESTSGFLFFPRRYPGLKGRMVWSKDHYDKVGKGELSDTCLPMEFEDLTTDVDGTKCRPVIRNGNCLQPVKVLFNGNLQVLRYIAAPVFDGNRVVCIAGVCNKESTEYRNDDLWQLEAFVNSAWLVLRRHDYIRDLRRAKEAAEAANRVKGEFLANVSHELRTPLNGMLSMLQLLDILPLSAQQREYVRTANSSGKALLRIISDILDFARIESGKMKLRLEPFDFTSAFMMSLSMFRRDAKERELYFDVVAGEDIPQRLLGDDARVQQIIFNIVGNAMKFTEQGGIRVECSLLPHGGDRYAWIYLAVQDTGIGIPEEDQARIFDAFTQIDSSSTRKYKGTGLGLSIVRHLVTLMGGGITIESEVGEGTTVHCSLRFARLRSESRAARPHAAAPVRPGTEMLRILVAEDDDTSRLAIRKFLQHLGYTPVCVPNGRLALELLQLHPFHCLFTDIQMPDMDGLEVLRRIRHGTIDEFLPSDKARELLKKELPGTEDAIIPVPRDLVTVTVSAHTMRGDRERFLEAGMDFYISKPVMMNELEDVLRKIEARLARTGAGK